MTPENPDELPAADHIVEPPPPDVPPPPPRSIFEADVPVLDLREALDAHARRKMIEGMRHRRHRPLWIALAVLVVGAVAVAVLWLSGVFDGDEMASAVLLPLFVQRSSAMGAAGSLRGDPARGLCGVRQPVPGEGLVQR
ncbi:MAG: hypothetical protein ACE5E8_04570 [Acidimicrobiia bacterium]